MQKENYNKLPSALINNGVFCLWKYENRKGNRTKIPYTPKTGKKARPNDISTFTSFEKAIAELDKYDGIGLGLFNSFTVIDIDDCINDDGELSDKAKDIIDTVDSYTEISPSGKGIHIICRTPGYVYDKQKYNVNKREHHIEIYAAGSTDKYITLTGNALCSKDINERSKEIGQIAERYMRRNGNNSVGVLTITDVYNNYCGVKELDDEEVICNMMASKQAGKISKLWNGDYSDYPSQSEAELAMCNYLAVHTNGLFEQMDRLIRQSGLFRQKWDEKHGTKTYGETTIEKALEWYSQHSTAGQIVGTLEQAAVKYIEEVGIIGNARYEFTDLGAGNLLADFSKSFARPLPKGKGWMVYNGKVWSDHFGDAVIDRAAKALRFALLTYANRINEKDMPAFLKWACTWSQYSKRKQYISDAASEYPVERGDFDKDPMLLNLNNGTLDLKNMQLRAHNPDDMLTKIAPVDYVPEAECPRWNKFVSEIMFPGESEEYQENTDLTVTANEKAAFLNRYSGYCLSGNTKEESFVIMYGPTSRNGKSVFVETVQTIMGTYACSVSPDTLMQGTLKNGSSPSEDIARLNGIRMASVGEIPKGRKMNSSLVKSLTGGDSIPARFLHENSFNFRPQAKLLLHTNHLPQCDDMSVFNSGRILVIPFSQHFPEEKQDKSLKELFRTPENQSGILNWLLAGFKEYIEKGLLPPDAVKKATSEYRHDSDKIARFIDDCLIPDADNREPFSVVYSTFKRWCIVNGVYPEGKQNFKRSLEQFGFHLSRQRVPYGSGNTSTVIEGYKLDFSTDDFCDVA